MRTIAETARYPLIRRAFTDVKELAEVINRSATYTCLRMCGHGEFTHREKLMALEYLGEPKERVKEYFPEGEQ